MYDRNHDMDDEDYEDSAMEIFKTGLVKMLPAVAVAVVFILISYLSS